MTTDARYDWLRLHSPRAAVFFPRTPNRTTTSLLTGTMSDAHPTPTPEKNLPEWSKPGTFPNPIMSQPTENGRAVSMRAILRPKKSIIHPPRGPPNMAPILRRDWGEKQTNRINERCVHEVHSLGYFSQFQWNRCTQELNYQIELYDVCIVLHCAPWFSLVNKVHWKTCLFYYILLHQRAKNVFTNLNLGLTFCRNVVSFFACFAV